MTADSGFTPTELLTSRWMVDAAALAEKLVPQTGTARVFLAGRCADDLAADQGPLELVALTAERDELKVYSFDGGQLPCRVAVRLSVLPLAMVLDWADPLIRLLVEPTSPVPVMPPQVAAALHALYTERELLPNTLLFASELDRAHIEVLPLFLAAQAVHELDGGEPAPTLRLLLHVNALLGAWGQANPDPAAAVPLFERTAPRFGVGAEVTDQVRRAAESSVAPEDLMARLDRLRQADPALRLLGGCRFVTSLTSADRGTR